MINYNHKLVVVEVKLSGKTVGEIRPVTGGFAYITNSGAQGETFPSIAAVKQSLEAE